MNEDFAPLHLGPSFTLETAAGGPRTVPLDHPLIAAARAVGTSFGDKK